MLSQAGPWRGTQHSPEAGGGHWEHGDTQGLQFSPEPPGTQPRETRGQSGSEAHGGTLTNGDTAGL